MLPLPGRRAGRAAELRASSPGAGCSPTRHRRARCSSASLSVSSGPSWRPALAYLLFMRRDFTDLAYDGSGRRVLSARCCRSRRCSPSLSGSSPSSTRLRLRDRPAASCSARSRRPSRTCTGCSRAELHRPDVTEQQLRTTASCDKGGSLVADHGPGNDWRCVVTWHLPGASATGSAIYQLDVTPDGRYVADGDGPQEVNGFFQVHTATGDAPNPLWQFDGLVDLLTPPRRDKAMQVTRQRRQARAVRTGLRLPAAGCASSRPASTALVLAGAGMASAVDAACSATTRSARSTPTASRSPTTRSSTRSATGCSPSSASSWARPSARTGASSPRPAPTSRSSLQIFDLDDYKLIWTVGTAAGVNQKLSGPHRRPGGPDVLAGRQVPWLSQQDGPAPASPSTPTARSAPRPPSPLAAVNGTHGAARASRFLGRRLDALRRRSTARTPSTRSTRPTATSSRPGTSASRRASSPCRQQALRQQRGRPPGRARRDHDQLLRHAGSRRHATSAPRRPARSASSTRRPVGAGRLDPGRAAPHRAVRQRQRAVRRQHQQRHRLGHRHRPRPGRADDRHPAVAVVDGRLRARRYHAHRGRPPAGDPRPGERRRGLQVLRQPAGPGQLHRPAADRLLPGRRRHGRRPGRRHQHPRHRRARPRADVQQGPGHGAGDRPRHAQHDRLAHPVHAAERPAHRESTPPRCSRRTAGPARTSSRPTGKHGDARRGADAARRPVDDQARVPAREGEPHLRPGVRRRLARQRRPHAGPVRPEGHAEPARARAAVRPLRQHLRHRHELRRGPQLADAGRQPGIHRVLGG